MVENYLSNSCIYDEKYVFTNQVVSSAIILYVFIANQRACKDTAE